MLCLFSLHSPYKLLPTNTNSNATQYTDSCIATDFLNSETMPLLAVFPVI